MDFVLLGEDGERLLYTGIEDYYYHLRLVKENLDGNILQIVHQQVVEIVHGGLWHQENCDSNQDVNKIFKG